MASLFLSGWKTLKMDIAGRRFMYVCITSVDAAMVIFVYSPHVICFKEHHQANQNTLNILGDITKQARTSDYFVMQERKGQARVEKGTY